MSRLGILSAFLLLLLTVAITWQVAIASETASTQIVTDEATGVVTVFIKGREVLRMDETGLRVHGNLTYSGVITDDNGAMTHAP